jgi:hypothetical protein
MTTRREVTASRIMIATPNPMTVATSAMKTWNPGPQPYAEKAQSPFRLEVFVFGFDGFRLRLQQLRLFAQKYHRLGCYFRAVVSKVSGHRRCLRLRSCLAAGSLFILLAAERAFRHFAPPSTPRRCSRMQSALAQTRGCNPRLTIHARGLESRIGS